LPQGNNHRLLTRWFVALPWLKETDEAMQRFINAGRHCPRP
jgi:hypothetical protein